ncbi:hypothetical protein Tco_0218891 [Tanacetum coccineum]
MRVNIPNFAGDTLSPEGFIDWLVTVEEVFEFKEVPENKRVSLIATKLHDVPAVTKSETRRALAFEKQNHRVGSSSSLSKTGASGLGNVASRVAPSQAKAGGSNTGPVSRASEGDDDASYEECEEAPVYDEEPECEEEYVSRDVGVNLVVRRSCLTPKADGDDWLKHNIFQSTCTILSKVCTFVCNFGSCDNLIAAEAVQKLGLKTKNHPKPYKLQWLKKDGKVTVSKRVHVPFLWETLIRIMFGVMWWPWMLVTCCWADLGSMIMI